MAVAPGLFGGGVHGNDEARVCHELCETVEEWIELLHKDGVALPEPLSGSTSIISSPKILLRLPWLISSVMNT